MLVAATEEMLKTDPVAEAMGAPFWYHWKEMGCKPAAVTEKVAFEPSGTTWVAGQDEITGGAAIGGGVDPPAGAIHIAWPTALVGSEGFHRSPKPS